MSPKTFLALCLVVIAATRSAIIFGSNDSGIDITIYREAGQLVVNGINPYDFTLNQAARDALRADGHGIDPEVIKGEEYDHQVSANLPASTALYGLVEWLGHGNSKFWRLALAAGDILAALAAFFLLARAGVPLDTFAKQTTFSLAMVYYPSAIQWGTIYTEDKQFQTALMLLLAGLVVRRASKAPTVVALAIGAAGSLAILFKALGVFLVPAALRYFRDRPRREFAMALLLAAFIAACLCAYFGVAFISLIATRTAQGSSALAVAHGSPWDLLPAFAANYLRPILCLALLAAAVVGYRRQRIDLLNLCAAACVIFICLWITSGSMDRRNMAMIFAMMTVATLSTGKWQRLVRFNFACQIPLYAGVIARLSDPKWLFNAHFNPERPDAIATTIFLISYFSILLLNPSPQNALAKK